MSDEAGAPGNDRQKSSEFYTRGKWMSAAEVIAIVVSAALLFALIPSEMDFLILQLRIAG